MPITVIESRFRELGRIRLGEDAGDHPVALDVWRLTSPHEDLLVAASRLYGGTVDVWRDGFELTTETAELPVLIPNQDVAGGQWLEHWRGSQLARRCNGIDLVDIATGELLGPCECDPEARDCKPTTVLRVVLPELPDLGVWRLVTRSYHAALELPGGVELLLRIYAGAELPPAILALEKRRDATRRPFVVPVVRSTLTIGQLNTNATLETPTVYALEPNTRGGPQPVEAVEAVEAPRRLEEPLEEPQGPLPPDDPKRPEWERLGRLLAAVTPATLPPNTGDVIEVLGQLEELMLAVGLWHLGDVHGTLPLDLAAAKRDLAGWRDNIYATAKLKAFAQRSLMGAADAFREDRRGRTIIAELEEDPTP